MSNQHAAPGIGADESINDENTMQSTPRYTEEDLQQALVANTAEVLRYITSLAVDSLAELQIDVEPKEFLKAMSTAAVLDTSSRNPAATGPVAEQALQAIKSTTAALPESTYERRHANYMAKCSVASCGFSEAPSRWEGTEPSAEVLAALTGDTVEYWKEEMEKEREWKEWKREREREERDGDR